MQCGDGEGLVSCRCLYVALLWMQFLFFCVHVEETLKLVYFVAMGLVLGERLTGSDDVTSWRLANLLE